MKMKSKKWLAIFLTFSMAIGMMTVPALAEEGGSSEDEFIGAEPEEFVEAEVDFHRLQEEMNQFSQDGERDWNVVLTEDQASSSAGVTIEEWMENPPERTNRRMRTTLNNEKSATPSGIAIQDESGLDQLRADAANPEAEYYLVADLDWSALVNQDSLPAFAGTFNGNGYEISNLSVPLFAALEENARVENFRLINANIQNDQDHVGVVAGTNQGTIAHCAVENANVSGKKSVGGIAGESSGEITFVSVSGSVDGSRQVGGIVGHMTGGTMDMAAAASVASAEEGNGTQVGGVVGYCESGSVADSYSLGGPMNGASATGGFVGEVGSSATISTSYTMSRPEGKEDASDRGAFVGADQGGNYSSCYYVSNYNLLGQEGTTNLTEDVNGNIIPLEPEGVTDLSNRSAGNDFSLKNVKRQGSYGGFDFDRVWTIETVYNSGFPVLRGMSAQGTCEENPLEISSVADLRAIPDGSALHYRLAQDLDLKDVEDWEPIYFFTGNFNGNGKTISNLTVVQSQGRGGLFQHVTNGRLANIVVDTAALENGEASGERSLSGIGVFGTMSYSSAANCTVKNVTAYGRQCSGVMFGLLQNCQVTACRVEDSQMYGVYREDKKIGDHPFAIGGFVGQLLFDNKISGCTVSKTNVISDLDATGTKKPQKIGGFVGDIAIISEIDDCQVIGGTIQGNVGVGGFVGSGGTCLEGDVISNCSSSADVESACNGGGFAGTSGRDMVYENCSATGNVKVQSVGGGFAGFASSCANMSNCYATGTVEGSGYLSGMDVSGVGGFVGQAYLGATIKDCYATGDVTAKKGVGGFVGVNQTITYLSPDPSKQDSYLISRCYATGNVKATDSFGDSKIGGFVGQNGFGGSTIKDCYATGKVDGYLNAGGFVGLADSTNIINCYATGAVTAEKSGAGGFAGVARRSYYDQLRFLNCMFDKELAGTENAIGYVDPSVTLKKNSEFAWPDPNWPVDNIKAYTTEEMKQVSSYGLEKEFQYKLGNQEVTTIPIEWDFTAVWSSDGLNPPSLTGFGSNQSVRLTVDEPVVEVGETATVTLQLLTPESGEITWNVSGSGSLESFTTSQAVIRADEDGIIKVSVWIDGVKKTTISIVAGNGGEEGLSAIFITPAPLDDGMAYNIDTNPTFMVKFTEPIDVTHFNSLQDAVVLRGLRNPKIDLTSAFAENNTLLSMNLLPDQTLADGSEYILTISKDMKGASGLSLKGIAAMGFRTNSFAVPTVTVEKDGTTAESLKAGESYQVKADYINNIPNVEDFTEKEDANVYIVVRSGLGARETYGGDILTSVEKPLSIEKKEDGKDAQQGSVSAEFTVPTDAEGNVYVDIYTWNPDKKYAKAQPAHITLQIAQ